MKTKAKSDLVFMGIVALIFGAWFFGMHCGTESLCKTICHVQDFEESDGDLHTCTCWTTTSTTETKVIPEPMGRVKEE